MSEVAGISGAKFFWGTICAGIILLFLFIYARPQPSIYSPWQPKPETAQLLEQPLLSNPSWSKTELARLRSLWIGSLPPVPPDSTNGYADNPQAAALGHHLFFDQRLSANNQVSCATCHSPDLFFTDGQPTAHGTRPNPRNTINVVGAAYAPWQQWDGSKDSLWAQALKPIVSPDEQGTTRLQAVHLMASDPDYQRAYEAIFEPLPPLQDFTRFPHAGGPTGTERERIAWASMSEEDQQAVTRVFVNMGKALAAYERLIVPGPSQFDEYVELLLRDEDEAAGRILDEDEIAGLRLFIGRANCVRCHNGPLFTDHAFHNTGVPSREDAPEEWGRTGGITAVKQDEFNCLGPYSDEPESSKPDNDGSNNGRSNNDRSNNDKSEADSCTKINNLEDDQAEALYAFKTPSLRNIADTAPYMHAGQFVTTAEVMAHYQQAPPAPLGESVLQSLELTTLEKEQIAAFLHTLSAPLDIPSQLLRPPSVP